MRFTACLALLASLALASCVTTPQRKLSVAAPWVQSDAEFIFKDGSATITGQAFMRQQGGGVVTAAGDQVALVPYTAYAEERLRGIYRGGEFSAHDEAHVAVYPDVADYRHFKRQTTADSTGRFTFKNITAGRYFIIAKVEWLVGNALQGGSLKKLVVVRQDQTVDVILSQ
jgi:hypothetical protein